MGFELSEHTEEDEPPPTAGTTTLVEPGEQVTETEGKTTVVETESEKREFDKGLVDDMYIDVQQAPNKEDKHYESVQLYNILSENAILKETKSRKGAHMHILEITEKNKISGISSTKYERYMCNSSVYGRGRSFDGKSTNKIGKTEFAKLQHGEILEHKISNNVYVKLKLMSFDDNCDLVCLASHHPNYIEDVEERIIKIGNREYPLDEEDPLSTLIFLYNKFVGGKRKLTREGFLNPKSATRSYKKLMKDLLSKRGAKFGIKVAYLRKRD